LGMMISDVDAEEMLISEAKAVWHQIKRALESAKKRKVKSPDKTTEVKLRRTEYNVLLTAIKLIRWERLCKEAGPGVWVADYPWEQQIRAELEEKWEQEYAEHAMRRGA
jgi:hypothetical protein